MLYSIDDKKMTGIPRQRRTSFDTWMRELSKDDYDNVVAAINEYVDGVPAFK